jgi:cytoskeletal protein RodZ
MSTGNAKPNVQQAAVVATTKTKVRHFRLRSRWTLAAVLLIVVLLGGGFAWWHYDHQTKSLTTQQKKVQNTISSQQEFAAQEEQSNDSNDTKAITYANLAASYADVGQCSEAQTDLGKATKLASAALQSNMESATQEVAHFCH